MTGAEELPDVAGLTARQQMAIDCAVCGCQLGARVRPLGEVEHRGYTLLLAACPESCVPPLPRRVPGAEWPRGGRPRGAVEPEPDSAARPRAAGPWRSRAGEPRWRRPPAP